MLVGGEECAVLDQYSVHFFLYVCVFVVGLVWLKCGYPLSDFFLFYRKVSSSTALLLDCSVVYRRGERGAESKKGVVTFNIKETRWWIS